MSALAWEECLAPPEAAQKSHGLTQGIPTWSMGATQGLQVNPREAPNAEQDL